MNNPDDNAELRPLVIALCDGELNDSQREQLAQRLEADEAARWVYVRQMMLHARLDRELELLVAESAALANCQPRAEQPLVSDDATAAVASPRNPSASGGVSLMSPGGWFSKVRRARFGSSSANALTWLVMAILCSGMVLTIFFCVLLLLRGPGLRPGIDAPRIVNDKPASSASGAAVESGAANRSPSSEVTVARLIRTYDCRWAVNEHAPRQGDDLAPGRKLDLRAGYAEILFQSGVRALLQGPATLEIGSRTFAALQRGKLTVRIDDPDARGFVVLTPGMKYTDLGTEFGVSVAADGVQELQVFRGSVRAEAAKSVGGDRTSDAENASPTNRAGPPNPPVVITAHQAIRVAVRDRGVSPIAADETRFVRPQQLTQIIREQSTEFVGWQHRGESVRKQSGLVAYYDFQLDDSDSTILRNRAPTGEQFDGKLTATAEWVDGRLFGKQAIRFTRPGAGVRVTFPAPYKQLSMVASVYVEQIVGDQLQMVLGTDSWLAREGSLHWQISRSRCGFGVTAPEGCSVYDLNPRLEEFVGRWAVFAFTCDTQTGEHRVYVNGQPTTQLTKPIAPLLLDSATIGGFTPKDQEIDHPHRNLHGRIDELAIFSRILSGEEIRGMFVDGKSARSEAHAQ